MGGGERSVSRREWLRYATGATAAAFLAGCEEQVLAPREDPEDGHLVARPGQAIFLPTVGTSEVGLGAVKDGLRFVPSTYRAGEALPLLVTLHGYGSNAYAGFQRYLGFAESARVVLLSPDSRGQTWDRAFGGFGADSRFIDNALSETFLRCSIDRLRIGICGFSDGASYALSLGRTNGDLFSQIMAFSPGYMAPNVDRGKPRVFVSHGTRDQVLSFERTKTVFVPRLRDAGYATTFREFDGTHQIPADVSAEALTWLRLQWGLPSV